MNSMASLPGLARIPARLSVLVCAAFATLALNASSASALTVAGQRLPLNVSGQQVAPNVNGRLLGPTGHRRRHALNAHGQRLHLIPHPRVNANQSSNWFGYNQGSLEQGGKLFNSITGNWTVPTATQHTRGQAEYSADWIGIGGGCVDAGCTVGDNTLIQTGTEQDVGSGGHASYSAWWEIIPAPSIAISHFKVAPGDRMHASIAETVPNSELWTITLQDLTRHETYSTTVPYTSSHLTAEWIEETPLILGTNGGFAALPKLSSPFFDLATTDGRPAKLTRSEEITLTNSNGRAYSVPSAPDPDTDGFNACAWATSCAAPGAS